MAGRCAATRKGDMLRGVSALRAVLSASCGSSLRHFSAAAGISGAEPAKAPAKPPLSLAELLPPRPQLKLRKRPRNLPVLGAQVCFALAHWVLWQQRTTTSTLIARLAGAASRHTRRAAEFGTRSPGSLCAAA